MGSSGVDVFLLSGDYKKYFALKYNKRASRLDGSRNERTGEECGDESDDPIRSCRLGVSRKNINACLFQQRKAVVATGMGVWSSPRTTSPFYGPCIKWRTAQAAFRICSWARSYAPLKHEQNAAIICRIGSTETNIEQIPFSSG